jgi:hypothetical protein
MSPGRAAFQPHAQRLKPEALMVLQNQKVWQKHQKKKGGIFRYRESNPLQTVRWFLIIQEAELTGSPVLQALSL